VRYVTVVYATTEIQDNLLLGGKDEFPLGKVKVIGGLLFSCLPLTLVSKYSSIISSQNRGNCYLILFLS